MKNVLLIAYYYPPLGGAGVQRTLKFAKYLNRLDYNVVILTVENDNSTIKDYSLEEDFEKNIKVYRVRQKEITIISKLANKKNHNKPGNIVNDKNDSSKNNCNLIFKYLKRAARNVFLYLYRSILVPDDKFSWKNNGTIMGEEIIEKENINLIISSSAPYSSHLIAYNLKKKYGMPWIADFRDPWVDHHFVKYPFIAEIINKRLEKKVVYNSDAVVTVSKPIVENFYNRYKEIDRNKFYEIPNGYDEEDFEGYKNDYVSDKFYITYCGTLYGKESPKEFLMAVGNILKRNLIDKNDLEIRFIGSIGRDAQAAIDEFSDTHKNIIHCIDYLPHSESIKMIEETFALLLILSGGEECRGVYTGKIFEYIRSNRMILALLPDGVAKDLVVKSNSGYVCYPDKVGEIEEAILKLYSIYKGNNEKPNLNWQVVREYDRYKQTENLAEIINCQLK